MTRNRPAGRRAWAGLLAALLTASCGTTLHDDAAVDTGGIDERDGTTAGSTASSTPGLGAGDPTAPTGGTSGGPGAAPSGDGAGPGGATDTSTGTGGTGDGRVSRGVPSPGVGDTHIDIGVYTAAGATRLFESLGVRNLQTGDQQRQVRAVIDWINANGGAGGRQVRPVFHDFNLSVAAADPAAESQAACSAWTQDSQVFAVVAIVGNATMDQLYSCLAQQNVIGIANIGQTIDDGFMRRLGDHFYAPSSMNMTRALRENIRALGAQGWFAPDAPVGVIRFATPEDERAVADGALPAIEALGLDAEVAVADPNGTGSEYASIALRFKTLGVRNVVFTWTGILAFATASQALDYHPQWAITSHNAPGLLPANSPAAQLEGAMGIGWLPVNDVDQAHDPGPVSDRMTLCYDIAAAAGEDVTNRSVQAILLLSCDPLLFLKEVLDRAAAPTVADFADAAHALGTDYRSAAAFRSAFGPDRTHDGAAGFRVFRFDRGCGCFTYTSDVVPTE